MLSAAAKLFYTGVAGSASHRNEPAFPASPEWSVLSVLGIMAVLQGARGAMWFYLRFPDYVDSSSDSFLGKT